MQLKTKLCKEVDRLDNEIIELSNAIYEHPEVSYQEYYATKLQSEYLRNKGFFIEVGLAGLETAFKAIYSNGSSTNREIVFLSEYDALPNIKHACGHNLIAGASIAGAVALKNFISDNNIDATICVYGTPAEETGGGKIALKDAGYFDKALFCMMTHPYTQTIASPRGLFNSSLVVEFFGVPSHAGTSPENGLSALNGMLNLFHNIDTNRVHFLSDVRIHGVIKDGGVAENIIPDYAKAVFTLRASSPENMNMVRQIFERCVQAAAISTNTKSKITVKFRYGKLIENKGLLDLFMKNFQMLDEEIVYTNEKSGYVSTDAGSLSEYIPLIHPMISIVEDSEIYQLHTEKFAALSNKPYAYKKMLIAAKAMAMTGLDVILCGLPQN